MEAIIGMVAGLVMLAIGAIGIYAITTNILKD